MSCTMDGAGTAGGVRDYVICTGVGVGGTPSCQASTTNLSVGMLHSGQVKDTTFVLTNAGSGTMAGSIHFIDTPPAPMSLIGTTTYSLGAGQSQTFTVTIHCADGRGRAHGELRPPARPGLAVPEPRLPDCAENRLALASKATDCVRGSQLLREARRFLRVTINCQCHMPLRHCLAAHSQNFVK